MTTEDLLIGLFVGLLCALIPLIYGLLNKAVIWAVVGTSVTVLGGVLFSAFGKSPFNAIVISALFVLFMIAEQKRKSKGEETEENDENYDADDFPKS